jgi:hypothetical protein
MKPDEDEATGLPGLRSWRSVYIGVTGVFAAWVLLLAALGWLFP